MISYIDTDEAEKIALELRSLSDELEAKIKKLYERLENVPVSTKEWVGNQANRYFSIISEDKRQYVLLASSIRAMSEELFFETGQIDNTIMDFNRE